MSQKELLCADCGSIVVIEMLDLHHGPVPADDTTLYCLECGSMHLFEKGMDSVQPIQWKTTWQAVDALINACRRLRGAGRIMIEEYIRKPEGDIIYQAALYPLICYELHHPTGEDACQENQDV